MTVEEFEQITIDEQGAKHSTSDISDETVEATGTTSRYGSHSIAMLSLDAPKAISDKLEIQYGIWKKDFVGLVSAASTRASNSSVNGSSGKAEVSDLEDADIQVCRDSVIENEKFVASLSRSMRRRLRYMQEMAEIDISIYLMLSERGTHDENCGDGYLDFGLKLQHSSHKTRDSIMPPFSRALELIQILLCTILPDFHSCLRKYENLKVERDVFKGKITEYQLPPSRRTSWISKLIPAEQQPVKNDQLLEMAKIHLDSANAKLEQTKQELLHKAEMISIKVKKDLAKRLGEVARFY